MPSTALSILEQIAATPSKTAKESLLKAGFATSPLLRRVCLAAYDPFTTYGIAKIPEFEEAPTYTMDMGGSVPWTILDNLASRKLSGNAAIEAVQRCLSLMPEDSRTLFKRVLLRDLRAGFSESTINKVEKGAIKTFPYMRCSLPDGSNMGKWDWAAGIVVQLKADGMFVNVSRGAGDEVWMTTRAGTPIPFLADQLVAMSQSCARVLAEGSQSHGELTVYEGNRLLPRKEGNGILNSVISGEISLDPKYRVVVDLWDQIGMSYVVPKGKCEIPYLERLKALVRQVSTATDADKQLVRIIPTKVVKSKAEAFALYKTYLTQGFEGVICKSPTAIWRDGTSKDQVKLKLDFEVELEVYGFEPGTPGTKTEATFGSLKCRSSCHKLRVDVSGFPDDLRAQIHLNREGWMRAIITVRANDVIDREGQAEMSLFLPRFIERRLDKTTADDLAKILATKQAAIEA